MGPHDNEIMTLVAIYRRQHPNVIIKTPAQTHSGLWEVSLPDSANMAFDSPQMMLLALSTITIRED